MLKNNELILKKRYIRLGVNIDHIATLRNARGGLEPDPVQAAFVCHNAGADQITIHLREDRRHITDRDLQLLINLKHFQINLEMAATDEIVNIAIKQKPYMVTLVPERRMERTTEGGLDVVNLFSFLKKQIKKLKSADILVSLFIEPDLEQVEASSKIGADAIELHTGRYAEHFMQHNYDLELNKIIKAAKLAYEKKLLVNAGHGLNYLNVKPICQIPQIQELNIGHAIISYAVFYGLYEAVSKMRNVINESVILSNTL